MIKLSFMGALFASATAMAYPGHFTLNLENGDAAVVALRRHKASDTVAAFAGALEHTLQHTERPPIPTETPTKGLREIYRATAFQHRSTGVTYPLSQWLKGDDPTVWDHQIETHLPSFEGSAAAGKIQSIQEEVRRKVARFTARLTDATGLYKAFLHKYGTKKLMPLEGTLLQYLSDAPYTDKASRQLIFTSLTETGFLQMDERADAWDKATCSLRIDPGLAVEHFIRGQRDGHISELGLGDGNTLSRLTQEQLGFSEDQQEGGCAGRPFTYEDITSSTLRLDLDPAANPDVVANMYDPSIYEAIEKAQGPTSLDKVADRSWDHCWDKPETMGKIVRLLKPGGIFEIWDSPRGARHECKILPYGFEYAGFIEETNTLQYRKINLATITPAGFSPEAYLEINPHLKERFNREQKAKAQREGKELSDGALAMPEWHARCLAWLPALVRVSIAGHEAGLPWIKGVPQGFNWKTYLKLNPQLEDRFIREQLSQTRELEAAGKFTEGAGLEEKHILDGKITDLRWRGRMAEWLQRQTLAAIHGGDQPLNWIEGVEEGLIWKDYMGNESFMAPYEGISAKPTEEGPALRQWKANFATWLQQQWASYSTASFNSD